MTLFLNKHPINIICIYGTPHSIEPGKAKDIPCTEAGERVVLGNSTHLQVVDEKYCKENNIEIMESIPFVQETSEPVIVPTLPEIPDMYGMDTSSLEGKLSHLPVATSGDTIGLPEIPEIKEEGSITLSTETKEPENKTVIDENLKPQTQVKVEEDKTPKKPNSR